MDKTCRMVLITLISALFSASGSAQELVIDNSDEAFTGQGFETVTHSGSYRGDAAVAVRPAPGTLAQFVPNLKGRFDIYLYWGDYAETDTDVRWSVHHAGGVTTQSFSQWHSRGWHFHGTYMLNDTSRVVLPGRNKADAGMVADAVKFVPTVARLIQRKAKDTITPVTLNHGDILEFELKNGQKRKIMLVHTAAEVLRQDDKEGVLRYKFRAVLMVDGERHVLERFVPVQESFYEPLETAGMRIWLDAVSDIFTDDDGFLVEKDVHAVGISGRPKRKARLVVNDLTDRICPEQIVWWYPEKKDHIDVRECYRGEDVWLGPYQGSKAHGGLDINMKSGTALTAPINFDDQYLFDALERGDNNNRWRGIRKWDNGSVWWLQAHHLNKMVLAENQPLQRGQKYAETAGVYIGAREHTHFVFRIFEEGESYWIDPWIFFWQTFHDNRDVARNNND